MSLQRRRRRQDDHLPRCDAERKNSGRARWISEMARAWPGVMRDRPIKPASFPVRVVSRLGARGVRKDDVGTLKVVLGGVGLKPRTLRACSGRSTPPMPGRERPREQIPVHEPSWNACRSGGKGRGPVYRGFLGHVCAVGSDRAGHRQSRAGFLDHGCTIASTPMATKRTVR